MTQYGTRVARLSLDDAFHEKNRTHHFSMEYFMPERFVSNASEILT